MDLLAALFGIGCAMATIIALISPDDDWHDAVGLALILVVMWAASNLIYICADAMMSASEAAQCVSRTNSLMDGCLFGFVLIRFGWTAQGWRAAFVLSVVVMVGVDIYREAVQPPFKPWAAFLNALFAAQLVIVAYPGGRNVGNAWRRCFSCDRKQDMETLRRASQ